MPSKEDGAAVQRLLWRLLSQRLLEARRSVDLNQVEHVHRGERERGRKEDALRFHLRDVGVVLLAAQAHGTSKLGDHGFGGRGSGEVRLARDPDQSFGPGSGFEAIARRRGGVGARGSVELRRSGGDPWRKGLDRLELWCWEDRVVGEQDDLAVAVREACRLVRVVDPDSVALEPGHAEDRPHAFERQDLEDDVALVLAVDLDSGGDLMLDREERAVGKSDGAVVGELDEGQP